MGADAAPPARRVAILVTGRFWRGNVEWVAHVRLALENGVTESTIDDIWNQQRPTGAPEDERLVYEVAKNLHERHELSNELYRRAVDRFGERGLVEIIGVIGFYTMVSMTLNAFRVPATEWRSSRSIIPRWASRRTAEPFQRRSPEVD